MRILNTYINIFKTKFIDNKLYKNSILFMLSKILNSILGFIFLFIAARIYSIEDFGLATGLISALGIIVLFSRYGFENSIIRFFPLEDKKIVFNTAFFITLILSLFISIIFIVFVDFISPELHILKSWTFGPIFIFISIIYSLVLLSEIVFMGLKKFELFLVQNLLMGVRLFILFIFTFLGAFGIFISAGIAYFIGLIFGIVFLNSMIGFKFFLIDLTFLRKTFSFTMGNFVSTIISQIPILLLPILILNNLGPADAAFYYVAFVIGNIVLIIPDSINRSLYVEVCYGENLIQTLKKAFFGIYALLIPSVLIIYFFSNIILSIFGSAYVEGRSLLILISISNLFISIFIIFVSIQNIKMKIYNVISINFLRCILLLGLSYMFIIFNYGIVGVGYAWLITHIVLTLIIFSYYVIQLKKIPLLKINFLGK